MIKLPIKQKRKPNLQSQEVAVTKTKRKPNKPKPEALGRSRDSIFI
jgi:hypothetical protein